MACPSPVKLAPNALTTLCSMKFMLGIAPEDSDAQRDAVIVNMINAVSAWVERMTGRNLSKQTYTQSYNASGAQFLVLLQWPIISVDYVLDITTGLEIPPDEYRIEDNGRGPGVLYKDNGWPLRGYRGGLAFDITAPMRALEVKYTAGYVLPKDATETDPCTLPYDLQSVVWGAVTQEFTLMQNGAQSLTAFSISDVSWTFDKNPRQTWLDIIGYYTRL